MTAARCDLVLGRILLQRGELDEADQLLASARGRVGALEPVAAVLLGETRLLAGRVREAQEPLRAAFALDPEGPTGLKASSLLADALLDSGDAEAALQQAGRAAALPGQPASVKTGLALVRAEALARLARALPAGAATLPGAARAAILAQRSFWLEHPDHPAVALEPAVEEELSALSGEHLPPPTGRELGVRASRLLAAGLPASAVAQAQQAARLLGASERAEVQLLLARALAADGRRSDAAAFLEEAWKAGAERVAAPAGLLLARDRARRGLTEEAIALLDRLALRFPGAVESDEASYLAARLLLEQGKPVAARPRLQRLARSRRSSHAADARWTLAWLAFQAGAADAATRFAAFARAAEDDQGRAQGTYWQARAGDPRAARPLYARVRQLDPLGWYGLLAQQQGPPAQEPAPAPFPPPRPPLRRGSPLPLALERAQELLEIGFLAEAAAEIDRFVQRRPALEDLVAAILLYESAGRYDRSVQLAQGPTGSAQAGDLGRLLLFAAYPAAYSEEVEKSASSAGLDPYLLLAVMRRESVFRADARSAAGAVGLLQLTPATARRASALAGVSFPLDTALLEPATSIRLGSWYLGQLVARFGEPAVAAAAYNAGPQVAASWAEGARGKALDVWVEEIPFRETRHYVKAVMGAWGAYRSLAGGLPPQLSSVVPEVKRGVDF